MTEQPTPKQPAADPLEHIGAAIFHRMGVDGVYARTGTFEDVVERLDRYISSMRDPRAEVLRFPPVMSRAQLEKSGYLKSFPNLLGCVCTLHGTDAEITAAADANDTGGDWTDSLKPADLVLLPAACYPAYPLIAARGPLPAAGVLLDIHATCFRREPSKALNRLQSFRMREYVCIGAPDQIVEFREQWMSRAVQFAQSLGLPATVDVANDPFFGRVGQVMAVMQRQSALKFELLIPFHPQTTPTACMSFNYHKEHFGEVWGITTARGELAHTSCIGFGMDRLAVALFCIHGVDVAQWPAAVRRTLGF